MFLFSCICTYHNLILVIIMLIHKDKIMNVIFLFEVFKNKIVVDNEKCNLIKISNKYLIGYVKEISTYVSIFLSHNESEMIYK